MLRHQRVRHQRVVATWVRVVATWVRVVARRVFTRVARLFYFGLQRRRQTSGPCGQGLRVTPRQRQRQREGNGSDR